MLDTLSMLSCCCQLSLVANTVLHNTGHERDSVDQIVKNVYIMDAYNQYIYPADDYAKKGINKAVELGTFCLLSLHCTQFLSLYLSPFFPALSSSSLPPSLYFLTSFCTTGSFETDSSYLSRVSTAYREALDEFSPEFIIYNAGTDILENGIVDFFIFHDALLQSLLLTPFFFEDRLGRLSVTPEGVIKRDELVFSEALSRKIPILMVLSGEWQALLVLDMSYIYCYAFIILLFLLLWCLRVFMLLVWVQVAISKTTVALLQTPS